MQFVPLWTSILDEPAWKILDLPAELYRFWTFVLMCAQKHDFVAGILPDGRTIARWTGYELSEVGSMLLELTERGLIDHDGDGEYRVHDWHEWRATRDGKDSIRKRNHRAEAKAKREAEDRPVSETSTPIAGKPEPATFRLEDDADYEPPKLSAIAAEAERIMGDSSWAQWADGQSKLGAPDHSILEALESTLSAGIVSRPYAAKILRRLKAEGYPKPTAGRSRVSPQRGPENQPAEPPPELLARAAAEVAKRPKISPEEFERRRRNAAG